MSYEAFALVQRSYDNQEDPREYGCECDRVDCIECMVPLTEAYKAGELFTYGEQVLFCEYLVWLAVDGVSKQERWAQEERRCNHALYNDY